MTERIEPAVGMRCVTVGGVAGREVRVGRVARMTTKLIITDTGNRFDKEDRRQRDEVRWPAMIHLEGEDGWEDARHAAYVARLRACAVYWGKRVEVHPTDAEVVREASHQLSRVAELLERESQR